MTYKAELNSFLAAKARNDNFERRAAIGNTRIANQLRPIRNMILTAQRADRRFRMNARKVRLQRIFGFPVNPLQNTDTLIRQARKYMNAYKKAAMTLRRSLPRNIVTKILRST